MSGLVGYIGRREAAEIMVDALKNLEYRGYDSAGVAVIAGKDISCRKEIGIIRRLKDSLERNPINGTTGIGHTRWATHGKVSVENAHPQIAGNIAIVHNGIVDNYIELKEELLKEGVAFRSETDSEVIAHLINRELGNLEEAVAKALKKIQGVYALIVLSANDPEKLIAVAYGTRMVIGLGGGEYFVGSDTTAVAPYTKDVIFISDGETAVISREGVDIRNISGRRITKKIERIGWNPVMMEKGGYRHYFIKEVCEQPRVIIDTLHNHIHGGEVDFAGLSLSDKEIAGITKIVLTGGGTSLNAAIVGKYLIEGIAGIPAEVESISELRFSPIKKLEGQLMVAISQSGETIDAISCLRQGKAYGAKTIAITNTKYSTLEKEAGGNINIGAGPEISVAPSKSFTGSIVSLYLFAIYLSLKRGALSSDKSAEMIKNVGELPHKIEEAIDLEERMEQLSRIFYRKKGFLYIGRGINYPIALEGALKMKKLSYLYADGYIGGELKHGPIALVDENTLVIVLVPNDKHYRHTLADAEEIAARGGTVIAFATEGDAKIAKRFEHIVYLPQSDYYLNPILNSIPLQFLAYFVGLRRGCMVDLPRNLAKSVTVE